MAYCLGLKKCPHISHKNNFVRGLFNIICFRGIAFDGDPIAFAGSAQKVKTHGDPLHKWSWEVLTDAHVARSNSGVESFSFQDKEHQHTKSLSLLFD